MGEVGLLEQSSDGTLLPGAQGETLLNSRDIFSVFTTPKDYNVITENGDLIGHISASHFSNPNQKLILGGKRWQVKTVDHNRQELIVRPSFGGVAPLFEGDSLPLETEILKEMRSVWEDLKIPPYLNNTAIQLLSEGRITYDNLGLRHSPVARHNGSLCLFPWVGGKVQQTLYLTLMKANLDPFLFCIGLSIPAHNHDRLKGLLEELSSGHLPDPKELAELIEDKQKDKFDHFLSNDLLTQSWIRENLSISSLPSIAKFFLPFL